MCLPLCSYCILQMPISYPKSEIHLDLSLLFMVIMVTLGLFASSSKGAYLRIMAAVPKCCCGGRKESERSESS